MSVAGFRGWDLTPGVGDGEGTVHQGRHATAAGREPGDWWWRVGVHVRQHFPCHLPHLRHSQASAQSPVGQVC